MLGFGSSNLVERKLYIMKNITRAIVEGILIPKIPVLSEIHSAVSLYKESKYKSNIEYFLDDLTKRISNLEDDFAAYKEYLESEKYIEIINYIKYDIVVEEVVKKKIDFVSEGLITTVQNELDLSTIVKYFKDLEYLSLVDILELKRKKVEESYEIPIISRERLHSRGLLKDNLLEETENAIGSLANSVVYSLMDGGREDLINVDYPDVIFKVSEWGKKFLRFYKI